ncbi:MAG: radical SAM protein [Hyphomicrobiaceae bacterium]
MAVAVKKFIDPYVTATGAPRASVLLGTLDTLWFNTGTLCNLACDNCYIESSPRNDRLIYLSRDDVRPFLDEAKRRHPQPSEVGFTGGEPFMNPAIMDLIADSLGAGFRVLVLTNAMKPMQKLMGPLAALNARFPGKLFLRVSLDHYDKAGHEQLRGARSWEPTIAGLLWLVRAGLAVSVAGRMIWGETEDQLRAGYGRLFAELGILVDESDHAQLILFPEMRADEDVPEITEQCWAILGRSPSSVMCSSSRMVVKHKGADRPTVAACTLLPYDPAFDLGTTLAAATAQPVPLNHPFCARFCVLGGASCSGQH